MVCIKIFISSSYSSDSFSHSCTSTTAGSCDNISFTCASSAADDAVAILEDIFAMEGAVVSSDTTVAKISIVGAGMQSHSGTASKMFGALYEAGINISMISTSEIKVSVLIDQADADVAVAAVHDAFFGE